MFCFIFQFVTGNMVVKKEGVVYHKKAQSHLTALSAKDASQKKAVGQPTKIESSFLKMDSHLLTKMTYLFNITYHLAVEERPFTDFPKLMELHKKNSLDLGVTYANDVSCKLFTQEIASYYFDGLKEDLENADYFSIFSDGSTDRTESEKEVIMVKYIKNYYPVIKYFKLEEPDNTKAEGILGAIDRAFNDFGMNDYHKKVIGYCSDGASVMMGSKKGVIKLFKDRKNAPWVLSVWCLAHRLELAVKDCFKGTYMDEVIEVLRFIYQFYEGSSKRNKEAKDIADIMEEEFLKPEKVNGTRWIDHKLRAASKLLRDWLVLIVHLQNYSEDVSNSGADRAKAKGIIKRMLQYKFVWFISVLKDMLNELSKVSLVFQREDINTSSAVTKLQAAEIELRSQMDNPGQSLTEFINGLTNDQGKYMYKDHELKNYVEDQCLERQKRMILQSMIDCLHSRFESLNQDQNFLVCHAFDHKNWPNDQAALVIYGRDEVRHVYQHFHPVLQNCCDIDQAMQEFTELKLSVSRNAEYRNKHPLYVWKSVSEIDEGRDEFQNIMKIIHLTSVYPLSNASCERSFSAMKRIKSDWRCRLATPTLDQLMRITLAGPDLLHFDAQPVVHRWWL